MSIAYEYWEHRATGGVWAVKLTDGRVVGVTEIRRDDVYWDVLPYLPYRTTDAASFDMRRQEFTSIAGRNSPKRPPDSQSAAPPPG